MSITIGFSVATLVGLAIAKSDMYSGITCQDSRLSIHCPAGSKIRIKSAFYGRFKADKCAISNVQSAKSGDTNCSMSPSQTMQIVADLCDTTATCTFDLDQTLNSYPDPCPGTSKYLEYSYECIESSFVCPGAVMAAAFTQDHFTSYRNDGGWTTDSMDEKSRVYYLPWDQSGASELKEFIDMEDLQHSQQTTYYRLNDKADGTGFVVRNRKLYYNKRQSRELVMFDLERRYQELSVTLPDANYYDTSPYSIEKNTDIDLAVDEYGLWAIYATERNQGRVVISKLDPNTLEALDTWETSFEKTSVMEGWMTCGVFYAVQADSENLLFMYDTSKRREITGPDATKISIPRLPESTTSIKYDPRARSLQVWSLGQMISYQLRFQPMERLYTTTTKKTSTTLFTTSTTTYRATVEADLQTRQCESESYLGFHFAKSDFNYKIQMSCPDGSGKIEWLCGGNPNAPEWQSDPETVECVSDWIHATRDEVERLASSEGLKQSEKLLFHLRKHQQTLRQFDYLAILQLISVIHGQNPQLSKTELQRNLINVIDILISTTTYPVWQEMNPEIKTTIEMRETQRLQSLLSKLSCKLRMNQRTFEYVESTNIKIYLEPISSSRTSLPVEIRFPDDTSNSPYRSLILVTRDVGSEYLGSLHTDCERPVTNYDIEYSFRETGVCTGRNVKCHSVTIENRTVCKCPANAGFISLANDGSNAHYIDVDIQQANTTQAVILAIFIFGALLHGAAFVASLFLSESQYLHNQGLECGLTQSHRAINLCLMVALVMLAASAERMFGQEMFCAVVSVILHLLCISSFVWATIRPLFLSMFTISHDRKLVGGCWLTLLVIVLSVLITAACTTISMFSSQDDLCMTQGSLGFTWSAVVIGIVLGSSSMLLIGFAAIKLRDNPETFESPRIRSTLLWTSTFTILLICEWALITLWLTDGDEQIIFGTLLAVVVLLHAGLSFISGCICNHKAQDGWRFALARFGIRGQEEKSEFYWTRAPHGHPEFTMRPASTNSRQPDCVQMTYGQPSYNQHTMQLREMQYSQWTPPQCAPTSQCGYAYSSCPTHQGPNRIHSQNHPIVNPSLQRDAHNFNDFRPADSEFEFSRGSDSQITATTNSQYQQPNFLTQHANYDANFDAEV